MSTPETWTEDEGSAASHEIFEEFRAVLEKFKEHRPDDLIGAFYNMVTFIQQEVTFPELILGEDRTTLTCPYCKEPVEVETGEAVLNPDEWINVRFYDFATESRQLERVVLEHGELKLVGSSDHSPEWETFYFQHEDCGSAVSIPPNIDLEFG